MKQKIRLIYLPLLALALCAFLKVSDKTDANNDTNSTIIQPGNGIMSGVTLPDGRLPQRYALSPDGRRLVAGAGDRATFYDFSEIKRVDLYFAQADWQNELAANHRQETELPARMSYDEVELPGKVGVRFKGNTSYMQNRSEKKSFNISVDYEDNKQKAGGYKNLNFNCAFSDHSFMREIIYEAVNQRYIPALANNYIDLYINDEYWGIYINSQQVDNDFIEEWFLSKKGSRWRAEMSIGMPPPGYMPGGEGFPGGDNPPGRGFPGMPPEGDFPGDRMTDNRGMPPGGNFSGNKITDNRDMPPGPQSPDGMPGNFPPPPGGGGGGFGGGKSSLSYLGDKGSDYESYYTLKKSYSDDPWQDLAYACDVLNNTPIEELEMKICEVLDLDRTLWFLACEIIFADDDSYVFKGGMDYYLYWDAETGRLTPIEYDGNECLYPRNTSWEPFFNEKNSNYPLLSKLLAVPSIRQRYLAHFRTILEDSFNPDVMNKMIDTYAAKIDAHIETDPKKMMTYTQFTNEISNLKNIVSMRYNYLMSNTEVNTKGLEISNAQWLVGSKAWKQPAPTDKVCVTAKVSGAGTATSVALYAGTGLVGNFSAIEMFDDGKHGDGKAGDGIYGCYIPAQNQDVRVRFYIEAIAPDNAGTKTYEPAGAEHDVYTYVVCK